MTRTLRTFACLTVLAMAITGCSTIELAGQKPVAHASADRPAVRCVCLWHEAKGQTETGQTARGFAGQVYFFTAQGETPVAVEGDVHVYLFDDTGSPEEQARPVAEVGFANVEWQSMRHESQLGPVYSLFVPYPRDGNYEANCTLRVRLNRPGSPPLFSDMTSVKLSGLPRQEQRLAVQSVDPRREQQWANETPMLSEQRTTGETIGIRRGDRLMATTTSPSRGTEIGQQTLHAQQPTPNANSSVRYYEEKLQTILKQRAEGRAAEHHRSSSGIEQTGYEQSAFDGRRQPVENPFYSY